MSSAKITAIAHNLEPLALLEIAKEEDLKAVLILGFKKDGTIFFDKSEVDNATVIYGIELAKQIILDQSFECPGCEECNST